MDIDIDRLRAALADRYTLGQEAGRGGMAVVFSAEDLRHPADALPCNVAGALRGGIHWA